VLEPQIFTIVCLPVWPLLLAHAYYFWFFFFYISALSKVISQQVKNQFDGLSVKQTFHYFRLWPTAKPTLFVICQTQNSLRASTKYAALHFAGHLWQLA